MKIASYNLTNIHQDKEAGHYVCEASNEGGRLEKEFKISIHGQSNVASFSPITSVELYVPSLYLNFPLSLSLQSQVLVKTRRFLVLFVQSVVFKGEALVMESSYSSEV